jgi:NAD(P)-dependent dehydrogenase (short-subunit alcohol dehydrogenase family)
MTQATKEQPSIPQVQPQPAPQQQPPPGLERRMNPVPVDEDPRYRPSGKLQGKVALVTGGDSGIGRAVAILFAREGAEVAIVYLPEEEEDADRTCNRLGELGRRCLKLPGDLGEESFCQEVVERTVGELGRLDILVNNAAEQHILKSLEELTREQLEKTFRTNIFSFFSLTRAALPHLQPGSCIINSTSIQAYEPKPHLMDYASTKAAILNFTRSLARELAERGIRVNGVAPGPIWTPLIPTSFSPEAVEQFGKSTMLKRPGQPCEVAPSYLFLASELDSSYVTGQILHPNGGSGTVS